MDSDEESEPREQKSEERLVIHPKPLRSTWSQLSAVSVHLLSCRGGEDRVVEVPPRGPSLCLPGVLELQGERPCRLGNVSGNSAGASKNVNLGTSDQEN